MLGTRISHYRLEALLGEGAHGAVYRGVHVHDDDFRVAVKVVRGELTGDAGFIDALKRECKRLDRLEHPSVVRFRELSIEDGRVAMVLELLEGRDLSACLAEGPLPVQEAVRIAGAVIDGLGHAHNRDVLHRDIKPSNIFLCDDGRVKVLDFGVARAADGSQATRTGQLVGTLDYIAPERFGETGGTASSDVYAVGLVIWEMLMGRPACPEGELAQKLGWHIGVGPKRLESVRPDCPGWLSELVAAFVHRDMAQRPADGAAALAMLQRLSEPVVPAQDASSEARAVPRAPSTVQIGTEALEQAREAAVGGDTERDDLSDPVPEPMAAPEVTGSGEEAPTAEVTNRGVDPSVVEEAVPVVEEAPSEPAVAPEVVEHRDEHAAPAMVESAQSPVWSVGLDEQAGSKWSALKGDRYLWFIGVSSLLIVGLLGVLQVTEGPEPTPVAPPLSSAAGPSPELMEYPLGMPGEPPEPLAPLPVADSGIPEPEADPVADSGIPEPEADPEEVEEPSEHPNANGESWREIQRRIERERRRKAAQQAANEKAKVNPASPWGGGQETSRGRVTITTTPSGADVFFDGKRIGRSPTSTAVDYGTHSIRVELADHKTQSKSFSVQVPKISVPFRMTPSSMSGKCNLLGPRGATVVMDGRMLGSLPRVVKCTSGPHRFRVTRTGWEGYTVVRTINVTEPGEVIPVSLGGF